ncbi:hypothetical protein BJ875DRAFT_375496, partial [Amylocarpus encephaloides]
VFWGVCWMFVIAHHPRDSGRGSYPSHNPGSRASRPMPQRSADSCYLTPPGMCGKHLSIYSVAWLQAGRLPDSLTFSLVRVHGRRLHSQG